MELNAIEVLPVTGEGIKANAGGALEDAINCTGCLLFVSTLLNFFVAHFVVTLVSAIVRKLAYIA